MTILLTLFTADSVTSENSSDKYNGHEEPDDNIFEERPPDQGEPANKADKTSRGKLRGGVSLKTCVMCGSKERICFYVQQQLYYY